jgi:acetyltransferase-like isoleucine patch superfamily enzyme
MGAFKDIRTKLGLRRPSPWDNWPWPGISIGRHSYRIGPSTILGYREGTIITVGAFCSIGKEVLLMAESPPVGGRVSNFSFRRVDDNRPLSIGHDVWIGQRAIVLPGITIGTGAVVGAASVVTEDVPPYAIVAGNPARFIRYRFDDETIRQLISSAWWEWSDVEIRKHLGIFQMDAKEFVRSLGEDR